ncbi:MAG: TetR/AcrR family transcriptional regulator [Gordonia sp.]|nr:TetR/AcrR family transcriptional regulator [Gordonia sp. (in: high G+C Gram-positive bacteria)]
MSNPVLVKALPTTTVVSEGDEPTAALLLASAVELMSKNGYQATSVRDLAEAAGTSPTALYHYFESKHDLLATILNRSMDSLLHEAEQAVFDCPSDPASRLSTLVGVHVRRHINAPRESLLGNSELRSLEPDARGVVVTKRDALQRLYARVITAGTQQGVFMTQFPDEATRAITGACTAVSLWYKKDGKLSADELISRYQHMMLDLVVIKR